ncbi:MAG TPA: DUF501 domain-containing protein [Terrimesophilobacter sp.]|nr:DUF501 domain-containing protein [Terrimesophilobacter sp.]
MTRFEPATERDVAVVSAQLGRPARGVVGVAARCVCGNPTVVATAPRLDDGTPFPTLYYLTHPAATAAMSTLEAEGVMTEFNQLLKVDEDLRSAYAAAHDAYLADRARLGDVPELDGISAGGMPSRVKCLHALAAHALAAGPGVNPIGDLTLEQSRWKPTVCTCVIHTDADHSEQLTALANDQGGAP